MWVPQETVSPQEGGFTEDPASVAEVFKIGTNSAMPVTLWHSHFAIQKPHSYKYWIDQDLKAISDIVQDIHPMVPNPYTLSSMVPGDS